MKFGLNGYLNCLLLNIQTNRIHLVTVTKLAMIFLFLRDRSLTTLIRFYPLLTIIGSPTPCWYWWRISYDVRRKICIALTFPVLATHGQRTSRESFFSKIRNFWAWADKLGWTFVGHFGYFQTNYWHYFGTVSQLFIGKCSWIFYLQKMLVFGSKTYNSQILPK